MAGKTAAQWTAANPVLLSRQPAYETDTKRLKIGDGVTAWSSLPYHSLRFDGTNLIVGNGERITNQAGNAVLIFNGSGIEFTTDDGSYGEGYLDVAQTYADIGCGTSFVAVNKDSDITVNAAGANVQVLADDLKLNGNSVETSNNKGVNNGYASLDSGGKVPASQLPNTVMTLEGSWNASTNTPTLANGTGNAGMIYECIVAGTVNFGAGPITFQVGDYATYGNNDKWYNSPNSNIVMSVNGQTGTVVLSTDHISEGSNQYFTEPRVRSAVLTGLSLATNAVIAASDSVLTAFGKLQKQITDLAASLGNAATKNVGTTSSTVAAGNATVYYDVISSDFTLAANTSEQTTATFNVPAGLMGINSEIEVWAECDMTGSVNSKTLRWKISGNTFRTFAITNSAAGASTQGIVANKGSLTTQITNGDPTTSAASSFGALGACTTFSVNTANAFTITLTGQKATAGETLTMKRAILKIYNR